MIPYLISAVALSVMLCYLFLITRFIKGWNRIPLFEESKPEYEIPVTIITACKNERRNLPLLFRRIQEQTYRNFEFILVDDHSDDGSHEYALEMLSVFPELKVIKNTGTGKKNAVRTAVYSSANEYIVSLDADSLPSPQWLDTLVAFCESHPSNMIICPVRMDAGNSFFQKFQQFEFASLVGCGAGAAGAGIPILCNGANMAFSRKAWLDSQAELHFDIQSGDDIFLLQSIKKRGGTIRFLKSTCAITEIQPVVRLKSFFAQRTRWASKRAAYADKDLAYTGLTVFMSSLMILIGLLSAIADKRYLYLFVAIFVAKWTIDIVFFSKIKSFFSLRNVITNSLLFSLIYPFYIVSAAINSLRPQKATQW